MSENLLNISDPEYDSLKTRFLKIVELLESNAGSADIKMELGAVWDEFGSLMRDKSYAMDKTMAENAELKARNDKLKQIQDTTTGFLNDFFTSQKLIKAIHSTYNIESFCNVFIETLSYYVPVSDFGFYLIEDNNPILIYPDHIDPFFHHGTLCDWDEGIAEWIFKEGHSIVLEDMDSAPSEELYSILISPMFLSGKPFGFIRIRTTKPKNDFSALELNVIEFLAGQASLALANIRLITDLTSTKDFLQNLMDNANDLIIAFDPSGRITFANKAVENCGFKREKILSTSVTSLFASPKPLKQILEFRRLPAQIEVEMYNPDGDLIPYICTVSAISDFEGGFKEYLGIFKDISSQRYKENKKIEYERLSVVAETAIAINYELNNPLSIIMGHVYMLYAKAREMNEPDLIEKIEIIDRNLRRVVKIINQLQNLQQASSTPYFDDLNMLDLKSAKK
jgi:PAS domain S-box-containing protein